MSVTQGPDGFNGSPRKDRNKFAGHLNPLATMSSTDTIGRSKVAQTAAVMVNQGGSTFSTTRVSKVKPNNALNDTRSHQRSEPPKVNTLSQFGSGGNKNLNLGHILEDLND